MSEGEDNDVEATPCTCCASCGIAEIDDIKLNDCDNCDLVKYCSDDCKGDHKSVHKEDCKKRAAELFDELLFKQPEGSHRGDCPLCCLPMPLDQSKSTMFECCGKTMCNGCLRANLVREDEMRLQRTCPFCREALPETKECDKLRMKRIEVNDPVAIFQEGALQYQKGDYQRAFEYYAKAAALGDAHAHWRVALLYHEGKGVEKDMGREMYHTEEAAIGGHPDARYNLGVDEMNKGNFERAVKHYIIAAKQGEEDSTKMLMKLYKKGYVGKEDLAATLRAHQAYLDAAKSPQRDAVE